jgi:micrococcal nuclease
MKQSLTLVLTFVVLFFAAILIASQKRDQGPALMSEGVSVTRVIDGDTVVVDMNGKREIVRLVGVDAPEEGVCYADESRVFLEELLLGENVRFERDLLSDERDTYDRLLGYLYLSNERNVNAILLEGGAAREYTFIHPYALQEEFQVLENRARAAEKGLWASGVCE